MNFLLLSLLPLISLTGALPFDLFPKVKLPDNGGTVIGTSSGKVETFKGIPFAQAPTGSLRLKPPQPLKSSLGIFDATKNPTSCPQFFFTTDTGEIPASALGVLMNSPFVQIATKQGEDCLNLNIQRPAGTTADSKLPVLFWIFGGGFELGWTSMYDGTSLLETGIDTDLPFIFVAVSYRVGGFGFLPGKEILDDGSANLGLLDQRLGLQWVADNIEAFGGDPDKVVIWGESAGAISVFDQFALYDGDNTYNGKPLFRGGIMDSGSVIPADPVDCPKGQQVYDTVVAAAGCSSASDTLECLRGVEYHKFLDATNSVPGILSYYSVALSYLPRPDGKTLTASPDSLLLSGKYAKVPFIIGDQEDEGTLFALFQSNISTTEQVSQYLLDIFFHDATPEVIDNLVALYPNISDYGSPFRTGDENNWYPQYKRLAAILGDLVFTLTRRLYLTGVSLLSPDVKSWSYLATYDHGTPLMGTFHGSDIIQVIFGIKDNYAARSIREYYFSFLHYLDPNARGKYPEWPQWSQGQTLLNITADAVQPLKDDFRQDVSNFLLGNLNSFHI